MKNITNTNKNGIYTEVFGSGMWDYRRNLSGELTCITYHNNKKDKVEKVAKKNFPH